MAWLLVQLKLRLLLNALRSSTAAETSFIISTFFAFVVAVGGFYVLALFRGSSASVDLTTVCFTVFAFGWLILPILAFGLDGTLDPASLALYPLRIRPLAVGLLAASATGAWPLANVLGLLGVTVGLARGALGLLVAVVAVVLQVLFCITLARFVTTSMAGMLRSRRGKDLAAFLVIPIFALYEFFIQVVPRVAAEGGITAASFARVDSWLRWLPPGLAAHAIQDARHRRARLGLDTVAEPRPGHRRHLHPVIAGPRHGPAAGPVRPARRRSGPVLDLPAPRADIAHLLGHDRGHHGRRIRQHHPRPHKHPAVVIASAIFGAGFVGFFHANSVGLTGPPFVIEALALTSRRSLRAYFSGQNIALAVIAAPLLAAICFGLAAAVRDPKQAVAATAVALAGLGAALGLSNIFTVTLAYPMVRRAGSPMRQAAQGYGSYTFGGVLGNLLGVAVLVSPVIVAGALTSADQAAVRIPVLMVCSAAYGLALAWAGVQFAAREAEGRLPELCQIAVRSTV